MNIGVMIEAFPRLITGLGLTLQLVALSSLAGLMLAMVVTWMRLSGNRLLAGAAWGYVFFLRGTPLLIQLFLIYYGLSQFPEVRQSVLWPWLREPFVCALLAFSFNTSAYVSEVMRGAITAIPAGQLEAAKAVGMGPFGRFWHVILPQAVRTGLPAYSNEIILMVKASSLASTVTLMDLTGVARSMASETYMPVEMLATAGLVYLALNTALTQMLRVLERRLTPDVAPPVASSLVRTPQP